MGGGGAALAAAALGSAPPPAAAWLPACLQEVFFAVRENNWALHFRRQAWHITYDL
jgi:hypothetical protein